MTPLTKTLYTTPEASELVGVSHVTLYKWEKEFPQLSPKRVNGKRRYTRSDIDFCIRVRDLSYSKGFSLASARDYLAQAYRKTNPRNKFVCDGPHKAVALLEEAISMSAGNPHVAERLRAVSEWIATLEPASAPSSAQGP